MDQDKVKVVREWEDPRNLKALRGYLGLTIYYRRFVKDYGKIAKPLTKLLKKGQFVWIEWAKAAMSRHALPHQKELRMIARLYWQDFEEILKEVDLDEELVKVVKDLKENDNAHVAFTLEQDRLH
ncbi:uncharacterized mitochondrial protein AtMg00860-like [Vigna angularis]|uniref:uncharacterized mitochondrial protein AtMg00860-like n=1 Tax=Phaseolus angularis TaxID=3914 RepID=UPI000809CC6A|nr:uncharacterized mitochondrial protein AtMg00860-like [Vigna angularis]